MAVHAIKRDNEKLTLSIDRLILEAYKKFCTEEGLVISKQVENFMKEKLSK